MKAKGCLIALGVSLGLLALVAALVGPTLVREGGRIYEPIAKMHDAQESFEAWSREQAFKEPATVTLTAEQIDRFIALRRRLDAVDEQNPRPVEGMRKKNERPSLTEIQGLLDGVGGAVTGRMQAYREAGMPPDEYRYIERVVYRLWLRPLRLKGLDPASISRVASELNDLAGAEKDAGVASRLKRLARTVSTQRVPTPEGFEADLHALLLARATEIDALVDSGSARPGGRNRVEF